MANHPRVVFAFALSVSALAGCGGNAPTPPPANPYATGTPAHSPSRRLDRNSPAVAQNPPAATEPLRRSSADHRRIHARKSIGGPATPQPCQQRSRDAPPRGCGSEAQCHSARHSSNSRAFTRAPPRQLPKSLPPQWQRLLRRRCPPRPRSPQLRIRLGGLAQATQKSGARSTPAADTPKSESRSGTLPRARRTRKSRPREKPAVPAGGWALEVDPAPAGSFAGNGLQLSLKAPNLGAVGAEFIEANRQRVLYSATPGPFVALGLNDEKKQHREVWSWPTRRSSGRCVIWSSAAARPRR